MLVQFERGFADIWIYDVARNVGRRFTVDRAFETNPVWSPDGRTLAYQWRSGDKAEILVATVDGSAAPRSLASGGSELTPSSWSAGSDEIILTRRGGSSLDVAAARSGGGAIRELLASSFEESGAAFSPDGRWLAYASTESGRQEVYVTTPKQPGPKWRVSSGGGREPRWRKDGRELFYRDDLRLYAVEVGGAPGTFAVGRIAPLFPLPSDAGFLRCWEVSGDGQKFLVREPVGHSDASPIVLALNWDAMLPKP